MKKYDFIIIAAVLIIAGGLFLFLNFGVSDGARAVVEIDGNAVKSFSLKEDITYDIKTENGVNTLVIKDGKADVTDADCKDKICVHHAPISKSGESIICLPHKVVITIENEEDGGIDSVA